jgi:hypothetical protein
LFYVLLTAREVEHLKDQHKSAIKMQSLIRGRAERKEKKERDEACAKLQARFRGKQARIQVQDKSEERYADWRRRDALQSLFRAKDRDADGFLTVQDLGAMLKEVPRQRTHRASMASQGNQNSRAAEKARKNDLQN